MGDPVQARTLGARNEEKIKNSILKIYFCLDEFDFNCKSVNELNMSAV